MINQTDLAGMFVVMAFAGAITKQMSALPVWNAIWSMEAQVNGK